MCCTYLFPQVLHKVVNLLVLFLTYCVLFVKGNHYFGPESECVSSNHNSPSMYQNFKIVFDCALY